jgi:F0F1-type ATP synthase assembly protein I
MMTISGVVMALILWLSAGLAHWTDSPLVGVIALIVPSNVFLLLVTRSLTRGALPKQRNSAPE